MNLNSIARKILYYVSVLFAFRAKAKGIIDKTKLQERQANVPNIIIDGLITRFTETARGSTECADRRE
jgi:DNA-directed RNA polymerase I subunit RPA49